MSKQIAIDGPAGAGKSTIAKKLAGDLSFVYVDTGAMYRSIGLYMLKHGIDIYDKAAVEKASQNADVRLKYIDGTQHVILNGADVSKEIREEQVGKAASVVSQYGQVRSNLTALQKKLAEEENVVMDGRDIGTCVLPNATLKIYLTASAEVRGKRRFDELKAKGENPDLDTIIEDIKKRDKADMTREISPLKQADDAVLVDSSDMTIDEVVDKIKSLYA
ncbi:MAG: (d)CMP kinase [Lachnospiraceae bacterium]|uniref:Cytidylate kinase n=1 Tax=Candidatus Weimeria bifida TaxID=2599074 RepID=A0A6N7IY40_9FIRM|nr:(d)CMP kinase [Candidatus Weimeria bifida]RRF96027.1 MAG: (d)CMP kinase [Lachnospiraceae bacterium]